MFWHAALFLAEAALVSALYLTLFRLRRWLGLGPLFVAIGAFQYLQVVLALSVFVEFPGGIEISPGSAVLFAGSLFAVLLIYIREDAAETRALIYGLLATNVCLVMFTSLVGFHLSTPGSLNPLAINDQLFVRDWRVMLTGSAALAIDVLLLIVVYEWVARRVPRSTLLPTLSAMTVALTVDSTIFVLGTSFGESGLSQILLGNVVGKLGGGLFFSIVLVGYLRIRPPVDPTVVGERGFDDLFQRLSYRQKYELAREHSIRDPLTGLFNRRFFDEVSALEVARAKRRQRPLSLVIDIDNFKSINDRFGHPAGDRTLRAFADRLRTATRSSDLVCRVGGEEFAVLLPDHQAPDAASAAERLLEEVRSGAIIEGGSPGAVTATVGVATLPSDADDADGLFQVADRRLYAGKRAGKNRVVASG